MTCTGAVRWQILEAQGIEYFKRKHAGGNVSLQELLHTGSHGMHGTEGQLEESLGWNGKMGKSEITGGVFS